MCQWKNRLLLSVLARRQLCMFSPIATMASLLLMRNRSIQRGNLISHFIGSMFGKFSQSISLKMAWFLSHMLNACFHVLHRSLMQLLTGYPPSLSFSYIFSLSVTYVIASPQDIFLSDSLLGPRGSNARPINGSKLVW